MYSLGTKTIVQQKIYIIYRHIKIYNLGKKIIIGLPKIENWFKGPKKYKLVTQPISGRRWYLPNKKFLSHDKSLSITSINLFGFLLKKMLVFGFFFLI